MYKTLYIQKAKILAHIKQKLLTSPNTKNQMVDRLNYVHFAHENGFTFVMIGNDRKIIYLLQKLDGHSQPVVSCVTSCVHRFGVSQQCLILVFFISLISHF